MNKLVFRNIKILNTNSIKSDEHPLIVNYTCNCFAGEPYAYDTYNCVGRDDYFIIYVTEGIFNTKINNTVLNLEKGTIVLFPPKYKYHYWGEVNSKYLCAHFTGSHAEKILKDLDFPIDEPYVLENEFSPKIKSLFDKMVEQFMTKAPLLHYSLACLLEEILLTIAIGKMKNNGYRTFKESIKYIHAMYAEKIQIPFLAKLEGLSNSRYITLFTKEFEKTPSEYILELRLGKACELLLTTDMSIQLIGASSGYKDPYFFSKIFKKHMGVSPQKYRKSNKQNAFIWSHTAN
ncbi:MAG: helix-turn-helix domain-containing protein [Clostridia bacterium]|nr:helix-turn-helix domain-containing protein [Clostridia bacterium]